ncbi:MAG: hypothetical protein AAGA29_00710 [Planctomycetota bacterium]
MRTNRRFRTPTTALLLAALTAAPASLASASDWLPTIGGLWDDAANWSAGVPNGTEDTAVFDFGFPAGSANINLDGGTFTVNAITANNFGILSFSNGTLAFSETGLGIDPRVATGPDDGFVSLNSNILLNDTLRLDAATDTTIRLFGVQSGGGGITASGDGVVVLGNNASAWTGNLTVEAGIVRVANANALGSAGLTTITGGLLQLDVSTIESFIAFGGAVAINGSSNQQGDLTLLGDSELQSNGGTLSGQLGLAAGNTSVVRVNAARTLTLAGGTTGPGAMRIDAAGTVRFTGQPVAHTGGLTLERGTVHLQTTATFGGDLQLNGGTFDIATTGSLAGIGGSTFVEADSTLIVREDAGADPANHSVALNAVRLNGGTLRMVGDFDLAGFLQAGSTGGTFLLDTPANYTAGGTNVLDLNALPGGAGITLGAASSSSYAAGLQLTPHASNHTLRFGNGSATLRVRGVIADVGANPTHIDITGPAITQFDGANTYTGETVIHSGTLFAADPDALGAGSLTRVLGGQLRLNGNVNESIFLDGGDLRLLNTATYSMPIDITHGTILANNRATLTGPIQLLPGGDARLEGIFTLDGTITGAGGLTWDLGPGFIGSPNEINAPLAFAGDLVIDAPGENYYLSFNAASTYTGVTELSTADYRVHHAMGLGSDTAGTVLHSGELEIYAATNEDITIHPGARLFLSSGGDIGSLTSHGGLFQHVDAFVGTATLVEGVTVWSAVNGQLDSVISGPGDLSLSGVTLNIGNTYTGTTFIGSPSVIANHVDALGSTAGETIVTSDGLLRIDVASLEPIRVIGGNVEFRATDAPNMNPLILEGGGSATATTDFVGAISVGDRGVLRSGRFTGPILGNNELILNHRESDPDTVIAGVSPFTGIVTSSSDTTFERPDVFNHAQRIAQTRDDLTLLDGSDRAILVNGANLRFENSTNLDGLWLVQGGFTGPGAVTVDRLAVEDLHDDNQPAGMVTVNDFVMLTGGSRIESRLQGTGDLIVDGVGVGNYANIIGLTGDIVLVNGGYAGYLPSSFASGGTTIRFTPGSTSSLHAPTSQSANNRIARTIDATDTYFAEISGRVTGDINLSDGFELVSNGLEAAGRVNAHDLFLSGGALTGSDLSGLTGDLTITPEFERADGPSGNPPTATLTLGDFASLQAIDTVTIRANATLYLNNDFQPGPSAIASQDRVGDQVEIISNGGGLRLYGHRTEAITETVGTIVLNAGRTRIIPGSVGQDTTLAISGLQRMGRSSIGFHFEDFRPGEVRLLNPGVLPGEMLGGWATTSDGFATVDAQGLVSTLGTTSTDINTAGVTDHLRVSTMQTLSASNTVLSAVIGTDGAEVELDLDGNTLTVQSGGVFLPNNIFLHNGVITSGGDELIFAAPPGFFAGNDAQRLTLNAEVADNGAPVALVFDSVMGEFGGDFNHTGGTWIHNSEIDINDASAVPVGGDLHLSGTEYEFRLTAATAPVEYGTITIDGGSSFNGPYFDGTEIGVEFTQINMGSGYLSANLTGDGLILKDKPGYLWMNGDYLNFTGDIRVEEGHLRVVGDLNDAVDITITGGMFSSGQTLAATGSAIELAGGTLSGGDRGYLRDINVTADSFLLGVEIDSTITGSGQLTVRHDLESSSGIETVVLEDADLSAFTGDWFLESGYASLRPELSGLGTGDITINPGATLQLFGNTNATAGNNTILFDGGGTLYANGEAIHTGDVDASGIVWLGVRDDTDVFLDLAGQVRLHDGLSILGRGDDDDDDLRRIGTVRLSGDVLVGSDVQWNPGFTNIDITGNVRPDTADASIRFAGLASIPASTATIDTIAGRTLTLLDDVGPGSLTLQDGGAVVGDGTLRADVVAANNALVAPGHSAGVLTVDGELTMLDGSTLRTELIDSTAPAGTGFDQLVVSGTFTAGGTLDLAPLAGFAPNIGDTFDLVLADSVAGTFDAVTGNAIDGLLGLTLRYGPTTIQVEAGLLGDLTGDGFVGVEDLDLLLANWGDQADAGDWRVGDADGSGIIGQGDLQVVLDHWSNGAPPDTNIPEPGSLALLALSSLTLLRRREKNSR